MLRLAWVIALSGYLRLEYFKLFVPGGLNFELLFRALYKAIELLEELRPDT